MNKIKNAILVATVAVASAATVALAADVGVSVSVGQPRFYGRIDIGGYPQPYLVYPQPIVIHRPVGVVHEPLYLHVPPGHAKRWRHYCGSYHACGRPVYFVQDGWYNDVYVPHYHDRHGGDRDHHDHDDRGYGHGHKHKGHGKGHKD